MKILFLISQMPYPPNQGAAMRNYGLITGLVEQGHDVSLAAIRDRDKAGPEQTPLTELCSSVIFAEETIRTLNQRISDLLAGKADLSRRLYSEVLAQKLDNLLAGETFDIIHMDIQSVDYLPIIQKRGANSAIVYDAHNAEYDLQRRIAFQDLASLKRIPHGLYSLIQARRLTQVETKLCLTASHILACSEQDANKLSMLHHSTPVTVIPNAISVDQYLEQEDDIPDLPHPCLVFTGKMDYRPNVDAALWFIEEILPEIRTEAPDAHFVIVGQQPHHRLMKYKGAEGITLTGFVPDVKPYIRAADVYVAPLRAGSGTRFKLLEALALQKRIVSTSIGAEGLGIISGVHLLVADTAASFSRAVLTLIENDTLGEKLTRNGRTFVTDNFDWKNIIPRVEMAYELARAQLNHPC